MTFVRFEYGSEDRVSETLGSFDFVQVTYDALEAWKDDNSTVLGYYDGEFWWYGGEKYSDIVIFGAR